MFILISIQGCSDKLVINYGKKLGAFGLIVLTPKNFSNLAR